MSKNFYLNYITATLISLSSLSATADTSDSSTYLPINDSWGYFRLADSPDGCEVYEARTKRGTVIIKGPLYRTSKFIFTTTNTPDKCFKS